MTRLFVGGSVASAIRTIGLEAYQKWGGLLTSPRDRALPDPTLKTPWAIDNFAFVGFNADAFRKTLYRMKNMTGCVFVVAPDVPMNAIETSRQFDQWRYEIADLGYPVAYAAQDGIEHTEIPWSDFSALFIGGSTVWKMSSEVIRLIREAKDRGKYTHIGRVNSLRRLKYAISLGVDSVDGSGYARWRSKLVSAMVELQSKQSGFWEVF